MDHDPIAHPASMQQFLRYARVTGIDLERVLYPELLAILTDSENVEFVPAYAMVETLQLCAIVAERPDLGAAFASWCNLRGYGPLSLLWDHCPTVADSIRVSGRFLHLETEAIGSRLAEEGDDIVLQQFMMIPARYGGSQFLECTMTLQMRVLQLIMGDDWHPLRIEFAHPPPPRMTVHRGLFRCPLVYGADRTALVLHRSELGRRTPNGNAHLLAFLEQQLERTGRNQRRDAAQTVHQIIAANLAGGAITLERTAQLLSVSPRSLQRRLADCGQSFASVLAAERRRLAEEYFATQSKPNLAELAYRLGYTEASAASRFLRAHMRTGARPLARRAHQQRSSAGGSTDTTA
ncbi:AraC family transcriptional regulator ligand-binding domain-containing protein [Novosphingobium sp. FKTRR1]|uniref:AraC family transcriptional regulator n=1 Tax=Novosphingobium sp. FKTRR1 TaxID=2879118 RepID=UPI001CF00DC1|nr:AraC family transcriptional regulator ligand-binding domain-containing protein [Novosphingobium sp. FKTRR1]